MNTLKNPENSSGNKVNNKNNRVKNMIGAIGIVTGLALSGCSYQENSYLCDVGTEREKFKKKIDFFTSFIDEYEALDYPIIEEKYTSNDEAVNQMNGKELSLFYKTASWKLEENDMSNIQTVAQYYYQRYGNHKKIIIEGYSDYRGNEESNYMYSQERINGVIDYLRSGNYQFNIEQVVYGEKLSTVGDSDDELKENRKVIMRPYNGVITNGLEYLPADSYLIDSSGSMKGKKWEEVLKYPYPRNSKIHTFNESIESCTQKLKTQSVSGNTPLYDSIYELLEKTDKNSSITVLSDGVDSSSQRNISDISNLAREKNITINALFIGSDSKDLLKAVRESGGAYYYTK